MFESARAFIWALPETTLVHVASVAGIAVICLIVGTVVLAAAERYARKHTKTETDRMRVRQAVRLLRYGLILVVVVIGAVSYARSWTGLGVSLGVVAAAGGFALQKPAASIAAWLTILIKRPFHVGDRIAIGTLARGEVLDITATHVYLAEVGRYGAEDLSGRTVMIPNNVVFEQPVTSYGGPNARILGEIEVTITYDSDIEAARALFESIAAEITGGKADAHSRVKLGESGVLLEIRYQVAVKKANQLASDINARILAAVRERDDIRIAYPHMDVRIRQDRG